MELSPREEDTLRHMLGVNDPYKRDPKPYRNHYVAGSEDVPRLERLASLGLVVKRPTRLTEDPLYVATEAGIQVALESQKSIRKPKAARVYHTYLDISDLCSELTFKKFLTDPQFAEARRNA